MTEKAELTLEEKLRLQVYEKTELEAVLKRQILLRDLMIRLGLSFENKPRLKGDHIIFETEEKKEKQ